MCLATGLEKLYTLEDVARHIGVNVRTIKRFVASGKLAVRLFGRASSDAPLRTRLFGRASRVSAEEFARFLREGTQAPRNAGSSSRLVRVKRTPELDRRMVFELALNTTKPIKK